jgi:hypothetical protein
MDDYHFGYKQKFLKKKNTGTSSQKQFTPKFHTDVKVPALWSEPTKITWTGKWQGLHKYVCKRVPPDNH